MKHQSENNIDIPESRDIKGEACSCTPNRRLSEDFEFNSIYQPGEYSEIEKYTEEETLYDEILAPCKVVAVKDIHGKKYAKKIINKDTLSDTQKAQARQECVIQSQMKHENIVEMQYFAESPSTIEMILEYCDSHSVLEDRLEDSADPLDENLVKKYATETLRALAYIHDKGIIHGDVKLSNLALDKTTDEDGVIKVIDFGLSLVRDTELEGKACMSHPMGTMGYMAPEITGTDIIVSSAIDMWAFGIALYKMCVAYAPTQVRGFAYGKGPIPFNKRDWKYLDPSLKDLIERCLDTNPESRISAHDALNHQALRQ